MARNKLTPEQIEPVYAAIWQNIAREDSNTNSRIGWALSLTSGQFTAIAFMVPRIYDFSRGWVWPIIILSAIVVLSALGVFFCNRTRTGVQAAHLQIDYLLEQYRDHEEEFCEMQLPRPFGAGAGHRPGRKSSEVFPVALLAVWSMILVAAAFGLIAAVATASVSGPPPPPKQPSSVIAPSSSAR